ncbi:hypothetical protein RQP46_010530 [Phenoliferia psychrophenolica]
MHLRALSLPLTILAAMERFGLFPSYSNPAAPKDLTIHIPGASMDYEFAAGAMALEEIMHYLPGVKTLNILMVGPWMEEKVIGAQSYDTCPPCGQLGRKRMIELSTLQYEDYRPPTRRHPISLSGSTLAYTPARPNGVQRSPC